MKKDVDRDLTVELALADTAARPGKAWRLTGPAIDATEGTTLAGTSIAGAAADWEPRIVIDLRVTR